MNWFSYCAVVSINTLWWSRFLPGAGDGVIYFTCSLYPRESVVCVSIFIPINYFQWCLFRLLQMRAYKREQKSMQMLTISGHGCLFLCLSAVANNQLVIPNIFPAHREKFERNILFVMHAQTPNDKQWVKSTSRCSKGQCLHLWATLSNRNQGPRGFTLRDGCIITELIAYHRY